MNARSDCPESGEGLRGRDGWPGLLPGLPTLPRVPRPFDFAQGGAFILIRADVFPSNHPTVTDDLDNLLPKPNPAAMPWDSNAWGPTGSSEAESVAQGGTQTHRLTNRPALRKPRRTGHPLEW
jgi:hypothetical protein